MNYLEHQYFCFLIRKSKGEQLIDTTLKEETHNDRKSEGEQLIVTTLKEETHNDRKYEIYRETLFSMSLSQICRNYLSLQGSYVSLQKEMNSTFFKREINSPLLVFLMQMFVSTIGLIQTRTGTNNILDEQLIIRGISKDILKANKQLKEFPICEKTKQLVQDEREYFEELKYIDLLFNLVSELEEQWKKKSGESNYEQLISYFDNLCTQLEEYYYDSKYNVSFSYQIENIQQLSKAYLSEDASSVRSYKRELEKTEASKKALGAYVSCFNKLKKDSFDIMRYVIIDWWLPPYSNNLIEKIEKELETTTESKNIKYNKREQTERAIRSRERIETIDDAVLGISELDNQIIDRNRIMGERIDLFKPKTHNEVILENQEKIISIIGKVFKDRNKN